MALKVWLPLSGDTTNYGLSDASAEATTNAQYVTSILGGSALSTSSASIVKGTFKGSLAEFSISAWVKEGTNSTGAAVLAVQSGTTAVLTLTKTATGYTISEIASEDLFTLASGWNHIAVTANGTTVKAYLNGALVKETAQTNSIAAASATYNLTVGGSLLSETTVEEVTTRTFDKVWAGAICNVKVYTEVISLFEVVNEANGLVVNYSFNGDVSLGTGVDSNDFPENTTADDYYFGDMEHDLSGNEYDATYGNVLPTTAYDTPMYSTSFDFTEANNITTPVIKTAEFANRYTVSVWAKGTGTIATFSTGSGTLDGIAADKWYNIVATSDGKKYVDGEEVVGGASTAGLVGSGSCTITIGGSFTGKLSDFRVYAKCMSAEEVATLYKRRAAVDNSGKLIASEFVVDSEAIDKPSFSKGGVVSAAVINSWTGDTEEEEFTPTYVSSFSIGQTSGDINTVDIIEF